MTSPAVDPEWVIHRTTENKVPRNVGMNQIDMYATKGEK